MVWYVEVGASGMCPTYPAAAAAGFGVRFGNSSVADWVPGECLSTFWGFFFLGIGWMGVRRGGCRLGWDKGALGSVQEFLLVGESGWVWNDLIDI